jgi:hypothetical protein
MKKFYSVLFKLVRLGLLLSPFLIFYWFLTDPINCITNLIGAWLWLILVIIPLALVLIILWAVFGLIWSIIKTIVS